MEELLRCKTVQEAFRFLEKDDKEDVAGNSGNVPDSGTLLSGRERKQNTFSTRCRRLVLKMCTLMRWEMFWVSERKRKWSSYRACRTH